MVVVDGWGVCIGLSNCLKYTEGIVNWSICGPRVGAAVTPCECGQRHSSKWPLSKTGCGHVVVHTDIEITSGEGSTLVVLDWGNGEGDMVLWTKGREGGHCYHCGVRSPGRAGPAPLLLRPN